MPGLHVENGLIDDVELQMERLRRARGFGGALHARDAARREREQQPEQNRADDARDKHLAIEQLRLDSRARRRQLLLHHVPI